MADDRAAREEKVIEAVREWLPELSDPGSRIVISAADPDAPDTPDGALFRVARFPMVTFACRRGGGG